jgi:hypothetical protein
MIAYCAPGESAIRSLSRAHSPFEVFFFVCFNGLARQQYGIRHEERQRRRRGLLEAYTEAAPKAFP